MLLTGIIGYPIRATLSPRMHNSAFKRLGIEGLYMPLSVTSGKLAQALKGLCLLGFRGVNVTMPHKQSVCTLLDELDEEAARVGAVNTILVNHNTLTGYNTDIFGFKESLHRLRISVNDRTVLLIGAGGVARSCGYVLGTMRSRQRYITNRDENKGRRYAKRFNSEFITFDNIDAIAPRSDLIINATSVNMQRQIVPLMKHGAVFYDINYTFRPLKKRGVRIHNGLLMLVLQGAKAFSLWTGARMPIGVMKQKVGLS